MINWSALGVLVGISTMLITIMGFVFMSGRLTERLNEHALAIVKMDSWKDGFNAGARSAGQEP